MLNLFTSDRHRLTLLLLRLLEHLLDDLLLLDQEGTDDAVLDAVCASRATICALDGLLGAGDLSVLAGAERWDAGKLGTAVLFIINTHFCTAAWVLLTPHLGAVPFFLMCR